MTPSELIELLNQVKKEVVRWAYLSRQKHFYPELMELPRWFEIVNKKSEYNVLLDVFALALVPIR